MPSFDNKILFLEALSGDINKISTFIKQYIQIGAFNNLNGLILGTLQNMKALIPSPSIEDLTFKKYLSNDIIPIIKTMN